jgi:hypothetical protein
VSPLERAEELESAENCLLRALEIAQAVTNVCEARGIALPGAVPIAELRLKRALEQWLEAAKKLEGT